MMLQSEIVGEEILRVREDTRAKRKLFRSAEYVGSCDQIGGQAAGQEIAG